MKPAMTIGDVFGELIGAEGTRRMRVTFAKHPPGMGPPDETVAEEGDVYYFQDGTWILRGGPPPWYRAFKLWEVRGAQHIGGAS